jgi:predicted AlkP superfamily phosphohydrolase/phosphomutase
MSARVFVIGLDSCDVGLVERWAADGSLPNFAKLASASRRHALDTPLETLPGAIWPEINMGVAGATSGQFYIPNQIRAGEARSRAVAADDIDPSFYYWIQASRAGCRVAVIDAVQTVLSPELNGIQLLEWGNHDRTFDTASHPPELLREIRARYGDHPVQACDTHGETPRGYRRLREGLLAGTRAKVDFAREMLARERWDLFSITFSEAHCAGHHFWHFVDPRHPWHDPLAPADLRDALRSVYQGLDRALGDLLQSISADARVFTIFSHGIDLYYDGPQLLPEVLARLGVGSGSLGAVGAGMRRIKRGITYLPRPLKEPLKRFARSRAVRAPLATAGLLIDPFTTSRTRAAFVNNNRCGAIRLNLRGREPYGAIAPGLEAASLLAMLRRELLALRDPKSREPIVARVFTADEAFGPDRHPNVPDLICVFRTDLGMIEDCVSPAVGHVHTPVYHRHSPRSGDHFPRAALWTSGPGVDCGEVQRRANVLDIAPTILRSLDVALPDWLDGGPLDVAESVSEPAMLASA